jgi:hypothetical protein
MTGNGNNWIYSQINAIAQYACGPAGQEENVEALYDLVLALHSAIDRIEDVIEQRIATRRAVESRWS